MLHLVLNHLKDKDKERPTTQQVCQQLSTLKEAPQYVQSHQEGEGEGTGDDGGREREIERRETEVEERERGVEIRVREGEIGRRMY